MIPFPDRLARPTMPANPVQADHGSQVYYMVCMACHGDQGQGLTPEFLETWGLGEGESCWQSKCHAANHPPEGFKLPKVIPPVVGSVIPARFETALDLHDYIRENMPWHAPGSLTEEEYWQLTAFLVRENGFDPGAQPLDAGRAAKVRLRLSPTPTPAADLGVERSGFWFGMIAFLGLAFSLVLGKLAWNLLANRTR
jgi:cytochrome c